MELSFNLHHQQDKSQILVLEDDLNVLSSIDCMLTEYGYHVFPFANASEALNAVIVEKPDLILLDISLSEIDGYQVCERIKQNPAHRDIPVIFMSGMNSAEDKIKGFEVGGVDYIAKPFHPTEVLARIKTHINLSSLHNKIEYQILEENKIRRISEAQHATIFALAKLAELRDDDTGAHLLRVSYYCAQLAKQLAMNSRYAEKVSEEFIDCIQCASPLHDIGKVAIPDKVLLKPGKLTPEEFEIMKTHTVIGAENLQAVFDECADNPFIGMGIEIALYHHERWDGTGYPDRLLGKNIPLSARVVAVGDYYDALRSNRCYRKGFNHETVKKMLLEEDGTHFDPEIVKAFLSIEDKFRFMLYN